jgi:hypothetical protein
MTKLEVKVLTYSLLLTCGTAALFGFAGSTIIGTFWSWFWISLLIMFLGFISYNSFLIQKDNISLQEAEVEALKHISKISVKVTCAYCQIPNVSAIQLNQKNTFKCESCNQVNGIAMQFMATTLTTPLESVTIPGGEEGSIEFKVTK